MHKFQHDNIDGFSCLQLAGWFSLSSGPILPSWTTSGTSVVKLVMKLRALAKHLRYGLSTWFPLQCDEPFDTRTCEACGIKSLSGWMSLWCYFWAVQLSNVTSHLSRAHLRGSSLGSRSPENSSKSISLACDQLQSLRDVYRRRSIQTKTPRGQMPPTNTTRPEIANSVKWCALLDLICAHLCDTCWVCSRQYDDMMNNFSILAATLGHVTYGIVILHMQYTLSCASWDASSTLCI